MCCTSNGYLKIFFLILYLNQLNVVKFVSCQSFGGTGRCDAGIKQLQDDFQAQRQIIEVIQQNLEDLKLGLLTYKRDEDDHSKALQRKLERFHDDTESQLRTVSQDVSKILSTGVGAQSSSPYPTSCEAAFKSNGNQSGVYKLDLSFYSLDKKQVYCLEDPKRGQPWLVVLRREDNTTDFNLLWYDYKNGFGDLYGNFFIGLETIHKLTYGQPHELWVQVEDFDGVKRWAKYGAFAVSSEAEQYTLKELSIYSGNAGDSLAVHKGKIFTTRDKDIGGCADRFDSGWWFDDCFASNLNGPYLNGSLNDEGGLSWGGFRGFKYSLKYAHMAIRPVKRQ